MEKIGELIAGMRKSKGMTQEQLATAIGISPQSISKWENGTTMPDIMLLPVIADTFGVSIDTLFGKGEKPQGTTPDNAVEDACQALLTTICSACDINSSEEPFDQQFKRYTKALNSDHNMRTAIIRKHGVLYYREEIGGLILKRPHGGWVSLLDQPDFLPVLRLCGDNLFCKALKSIILIHQINNANKIEK